MINSFYNINLTTDVTLPVVNVHVYIMEYLIVDKKH